MLETLIASYHDVLILVARCLLVALYLLTGWQKLSGYTGTVKYMQSLGVPFPNVATVGSIVMELFVCLALALGLFTRSLALLMVGFTFITALVGHHFWTMEGPARHANQLNFFKNLSIMGGFLLLAVTGAGRFALM